MLYVRYLAEAELDEIKHDGKAVLQIQIRFQLDPIIVIGSPRSGSGSVYHIRIRIWIQQL